MLQIIQYAVLAVDVGLIVLAAVGGQVTAFLTLDELREMGVCIPGVEERNDHD